MVREDWGILRVKELRRVHGIRQTREKTEMQVKPGTLLGLTPRHLRRLIAQVKPADGQGLADRGRGKPWNRQIPEKVQAKALTRDAERYRDGGSTVAAEQRAERQGITLSVETLWGGLLAKDVPHVQPHRAWRERKAPVGALI